MMTDNGKLPAAQVTMSKNPTASLTPTLNDVLERNGAGATDDFKTMSDNLKPTKNTTRIKSPGPNDVLLGRGPGPNSYEGNKVSAVAIPIVTWSTR